MSEKYATWSALRREFAADDPDFEPEVAQARLRLAYGRFVYDLRAAAGLTQRELAARMSTTQSAIAAMESGAVNPTVELLRRLAHALDLRMTLTVEGHTADSAGRRELQIAG
ncbi:MAG: helix-turn-helix domain-containing protein [Egibacteraceae bacterium]